MRGYHCCTLLWLLTQAAFERAAGIGRDAVNVEKGRTKSPTTRPTRIRGGNLTARQGSSIYELNPNYVPSHPQQTFPVNKPLNPNYVLPHPRQTFTVNKPVTLGDIESSSTAQSYYFDDNTQVFSGARHLTLVKLLKRWYHTNPTLAQVTAACVIIFVSWQNPSAHATLNNHFVCSRRNVVAHRWTGLLLSAISHSDLWHLVFNLAALLSLGPNVQQALERSYQRKSTSWTLSSSSSSSQLLLWPLMIGAALSGSVAFLALGGSKRGHGGCLGLSAVTMSLLAVYAQAFPDRILGILVAGILPVRLPAYQLLQVVLLWSLVGSVVAMRYPQGVAHSAHLGGLLFGLGYFEFVRRNWHWGAVVERWWKQQHQTSRQRGRL
jgi:membrane associated rhomboid family serine protease